MLRPDTASKSTLIHVFVSPHSSDSVSSVFESFLINSGLILYIATWKLMNTKKTIPFLLFFGCCFYLSEKRNKTGNNTFHKWRQTRQCDALMRNQIFSCEIPFLRATTATTTTEQRNNTTAEKEPSTRGQSTPDSSADITLALLWHTKRTVSYIIFLFMDTGVELPFRVAVATSIAQWRISCDTF